MMTTQALLIIKNKATLLGQQRIQISDFYVLAFVDN